MYIRRKIYSAIDDEFVPVNETFGDYSENLYSVTMTEEELALFSELREELYSSYNYYMDRAEMSKKDLADIAKTRRETAMAAFEGQPKNGELITDSMSKTEKKLARIQRGESNASILTDAEIKAHLGNKKATKKEIEAFRQDLNEIGSRYGTDVKAPVVYTNEKEYKDMVKRNQASYKKAPKMTGKQFEERVKADKARVTEQMKANKIILQNAADARAYRAAQAEAAAQAAKKAARNAKLAKYGKYGAVGLGATGLIGGGIAAYNHFKNKD